MSLSTHPAVIRAYREGTYTDKNGTAWRKGLDGWFVDSPGMIQLAYHHMMVDLIEKENPLGDRPEHVD